MPYVNRNENNEIISMHADAPAEESEYLPATHTDVIAFLNANSSDAQALEFLSSSDYELVRVLEDLIELMVDKNIILFTELPPIAQQKLVQRRGARKNLRESDSIMIGEDDIL